jgi:predicted RNA-binding protein with RPS1 domain
VEGQIVSIQDYGFFVEFGLDGNGLIHKSNFGVFGRDLTDLFEAGDWVVVEILGYKIDHRRFDLKLCGLAGDPVQVEAQSSVVPSS